MAFRLRAGIVALTSLLCPLLSGLCSATQGEQILLGRVTDLETGEPIAGAGIRVVPLPKIRAALGLFIRDVDDPLSPWEQRTETDGNGMYRFEGLPLVPIMVGAVAEGYVTLPFVEQSSLRRYVHLERGMDNVYDIALYPEDVVEVTVVDSENRPVQGASISVWSGGKCHDYPGRTDQQGRITVNKVSRFLHTLRASLDDGSPGAHVPMPRFYGGSRHDRSCVVIEANAFRERTPSLETKGPVEDREAAVQGSGEETPASASHWIEVKALDEEGQPVPGVLVSPSRLSWDPSSVRITDQEGRAKLIGLSGPTVKLHLYIYDSFFPAKEEFEVDQAVEVEMKPLWRVAGRVLDGETREPVPHFTIRRVYITRGMGRHKNLFLHHILNSSQGRFDLGSTHASEILEIEAKGYLSRWGIHIESKPPGEPQEEVYLLTPVDGEGLTGRLVTEDTGTPVPNALITYAEGEGEGTLLSWEHIRPSSLRWKHAQRTWSDAEGDFVFPEGTSQGTLFIEPAGRARRVVAPEEQGAYETDAGELRIPLREEASFSGEALCDGTPLRCAWLSLWKEGERGEGLEAVYSDWAGGFQWRGLSAGTYRLSLYPNKRDQTRFGSKRTISFHLDEGEEKSLTFGSSENSSSFAGQIVFENGPPEGDRSRIFKNTEMELKPLFDAVCDEITLRPDEGGCFQCTGLQPGAYYLSVALHAVHSKGGLRWEPAAVHEPIQIVRGTTRDIVIRWKAVWTEE